MAQRRKRRLRHAGRRSEGLSGQQAEDLGDHGAVGGALPGMALEQIGRETKSLYESVRPGIVRIQLPPTYWPAQASNSEIPEKWKLRLDPAVRQQIEEAQRRWRSRSVGCG